MIFLIFYIIAWIVGIISCIVSGTFSNFSDAIQIILLSQLTVNLGLMGLLGFVGHVFKSDEIAKHIGWQTGSLFQREIGYCNLGVAVLGISCFFIRDNFWLATIIFTSIFLVGAAIIHIKEMREKGNFKPGNALMVMPDLLTPFTLVILWTLIKI